MRCAFLDTDRPLEFAHRGGASGAPENSAAAFERAVALGYRYIETDVHTTADGVLVAFHDETLDRATDRAGAIADLPYAEVARARIGGIEPIPRLEDVLTAFPRTRFNIDVKQAASIAPLAAALRRTGAHDRVCVASFSARRLALMRRVLDRPVCTSLGRSGVAALKLVSLLPSLARAARFGAPCVQVPPEYGPFAVITPAFLRMAHRLDIQVHAWTINDRAEMHRLLDLGVDGIMTDDVVALREVLVERGNWQGGQDRSAR